MWWSLLFSFFTFRTGLRNSPWEVWEKRQPICYHLRGVSQSSSIRLLTAAPSMAKHVNVIELCGDVRNNAVCGWVEVGGGWTGRRVRCVSLLPSVWLKKADAETPMCSVRIGGGREIEKKKEREGTGVKGIYCQEPSISGNGYACIGVNQTCCFSSSMAEVKKQQRCNWLQVWGGLIESWYFNTSG